MRFKSNGRKRSTLRVFVHPTTRFAHSKRSLSLHALPMVGPSSPQPLGFAGTGGHVSGDVAKARRDTRSEPGFVVS